jgi:hypothetical protein
MVLSIQHFLRRVKVTAVAAVAMLCLAGTSGSAQMGCVPEDFSAWAVNRGPSAFFLTSVVDIHVARWSTEREKDRFARTLLDQGPDALSRTFREAAPVGVIRTPLTMPDDVVFAWQEPLVDGGRRIILITDRPMVVWKESMQLEGTEDTFTVLELRLAPTGEGEGKVAIGANIGVDRSLDLIELEDYAAEPLRLIDVRPRHITS